MSFWEGTFYVTNIEVKQPFLESLVGFPPGNAYITVEINAIRYRYGGSDPATNDGHVLEPGNGIVIHAPDVEEFRAISTSAGGSKVVFTVKGK